MVVADSNNKVGSPDTLDNPDSHSIEDMAHKEHSHCHRDMSLVADSRKVPHYLRYMVDKPLLVVVPVVPAELVVVQQEVVHRRVVCVMGLSHAHDKQARGAVHHEWARHEVSHWGQEMALSIQNPRSLNLFSMNNQFFA